MFMFPRRDVFDGNQIVGIFCNLRAHVQHNQGRNQPLRRNSIHRPQAAGKMRRRVNVRTKMLGKANAAGEIFCFSRVATVLAEKSGLADSSKAGVRALMEWVKSTMSRKPLV